jgi:tetratricopeptide (TPR) repeat protein
LCAIELSEPKRPQVALAHCEAATKVLERAWRLEPGKLDIGLNLATAYAWQADAYAALGKWPEALAQREAQSRLVDLLTNRFPRDRRAVEARLLADFGMALLLSDLKRPAEAVAKLARAESTAKDLQAHDPDNGDWREWLQQIAAHKARLKKINFR